MWTMQYQRPTITHYTSFLDGVHLDELDNVNTHRVKLAL